MRIRPYCCRYLLLYYILYMCYIILYYSMYIYIYICTIYMQCIYIEFFIESHRILTISIYMIKHTQNTHLRFPMHLLVFSLSFGRSSILVLFSWQYYYLYCNTCSEHINTSLYIYTHMYLYTPEYDCVLPKNTVKYSRRNMLTYSRKIWQYIFRNTF